MIFETEAIILKDITLADNRRLLTILSKTKGKLVASSNLMTSSKGRSSSAIKPFNLSRLQVYKKRDHYNINSGEVIKSFYRIGEDVDKYMNSSYILELTEKALMEGEAVPKVFNLLVDFLSAIEKRKTNMQTLVIAYEIKLLKELGYAIHTSSCINCDSKEKLYNISAEEGGVVCEACMCEIDVKDRQRLIGIVDLGIIDIINFLVASPFKDFEKIGLDKERIKIMRDILDKFIQNHLNIENIKSRNFLLLE